MLASVAVLLASILALLSLVPQILRIHRTGQVAGLTMAWPVIAMVSNTGWTVYVLRQELYAAVWSTAAMVIAYGVVAGQLLVRRVPWQRAAGLGAAWGAFLTLVFLIDLAAGWTLLGFVLAIAFVVQVSPAIWVAWRTAAPSGISPGTWTIIGVEVSLWGVYGAAHGDAAVISFGVVGVLACGSMLLRWWLTRDAIAAALRRVPQPV